MLSITNNLMQDKSNFKFMKLFKKIVFKIIIKDMIFTEFDYCCV